MHKIKFNTRALSALTWIHENGNERIALCPFCGESKGHFYVNLKKGKYNCFICGAGGSIKGIEPQFNSSIQASRSSFIFPADVVPIYQWNRVRFGSLCAKYKDLLTFMLSRGLLFDDIIRYSVCWKEGLLFFPLFSTHDSTSVIAGQWSKLDRSTSLLKYWNIGNCGTTFFNFNNICTYTSIVIVEGILDTLSVLHTMGTSFPVIGALRSKLTEDQKVLLSKFSTIIWALDSDQTDVAFKNKLFVKSKLIFKVNWPEKDPNECSKEQIRYAFKHIEPVTS